MNNNKKDKEKSVNGMLPTLLCALSITLMPYVVAKSSLSIYDMHLKKKASEERIRKAQKLISKLDLLQSSRKGIYGINSIPSVIENLAHGDVSSLHEAAKSGDIRACRWYAEACALGIHTEVSQNNAYTWYKKAVVNDDVDALVRLGSCYFFGNGVEQNYSEALNLYRKASELGSADADVALGGMYHFGNGVKKSNTEASRYFLQAAKKGHVNAQSIIGSAFAEGIGIEKSHSKAKYWLSMASKNGHSDAGVFLNELIKSEPSNPFAHSMDHKPQPIQF